MAYECCIEGCRGKAVIAINCEEETCQVCHLHAGIIKAFVANKVASLTHHAPNL